MKVSRKLHREREVRSLKFEIVKADITPKSSRRWESLFCKWSLRTFLLKSGEATPVVGEKPFSILRAFRLGEFGVGSSAFVFFPLMVKPSRRI